ncbi:MAG: PD-(D/E)XK nuclease family protein [Bacteroidetes bacterium]|nr:PD-(D/E)XK nuclease family protein [Bacteroidota bacterium]
MKLSFLEETLLTIKKSHSDLSNCLFILPSKRAGGFLRNYLRKQTKAPAFAPTIISIEEFIETLSGLRIIPSEELILKSYQAYLHTNAITQKETFQEYVNWANTLLNDFSEIDRYLVPQESFFSYLGSIKSLEKWGASAEESTLVKNYLSFWNNIYPFYEELNELLNKTQQGYQGMVYRKAAEDIEHYIYQKKDQPHFFIGFNALNTAEQHIFQALLESGNTEVYWDTDSYFYEDPSHSASSFLRNYLTQWKYYKEHPIPVFPAHYSQPKSIGIVTAPNSISEVKHLGNYLATLSQETLNDTAVVLADETLLMPVLYSLPDNVTQANVTMGLPLSSLPSSQFFTALLQYQTAVPEQIYYKQLLDILNLPAAKIILNHPENILTQLASVNSAYITLPNLLLLGGEENRTFLTLLFGSWEDDPHQAIVNCKSLIDHLYNAEQGKTIEKLVLKKLDGIFTSLLQYLNQYDSLAELSSIAALFSELISGTTLDFAGDAYEGLQIMGVLETRGLDFKNIIMLSVNEGVLPTGKSNNSFITYDLKKQYNLPLYTEKDAVYTYHFYRLLQRAETITLSYNTFSHGMTSGEKSRYLLQLEIDNLPEHALRQETIAPNISIPIHSASTIIKNKAVSQRIEEIAGRYFSPSALTSYIRNPLDFYYQKILKVAEVDLVEETVAHNTLGTIVHETLEKLYTPLIGLLLTPELLSEAKKGIALEVTNQFKRHYKEGDITKGKNLIIFEVAKRYVSNLITLDIAAIKDGNTIKIVELEVNLKTQIHIPELNYPVYIGGSVDRIDLYNDQIRVIDYKTGSVQQSELGVTNWEDITTDYKYSKAFQVLIYSLLMASEQGTNSMEAGIISFKNLQTGFLPFTKKEGPRTRGGQTTITEEIRTEFSLVLKQLILEICDPTIPFTEKEV